MMQKILRLLIAFLLLIFGVYSMVANNPKSTTPESGHIKDINPKAYNADWSTETHEKTIPNYSVVFPQNKVNTIEINMTAEQWESININMQELCGKGFGESGMMGGPPDFNNQGNEQQMNRSSFDPSQERTQGNFNRPGENNNENMDSNHQGHGGMGMMSDNPDFINVNVSFNSKDWKNVGFRLKGNSSLIHSWSQGNYKLPFKLDFDEFEDEFPEVKDQHFFGFKKLSFSPAFNDQSLIREKLASDIFRLAGIPSAQTAFYRVYINFGSGSQYCGVYTVVEYPDDNMIKKQCGEDSGNIYKPESRFSQFEESEFEKKNNKADNDYTDVETLITIANSNQRKSNPKKWRPKLESVFNIDEFIKYLAVNNTILNWDTYGTMPHNHYLYNDSIDKLTWIPWDNNESLSGSSEITGQSRNAMPGGMGNGGPQGMPPGGGMMGGGMGGPPPGGGGPGGRPPGGFNNNSGMMPPQGMNNNTETNMEAVPSAMAGHQCISLSMNEVGEDWPLIKCVVDDEVYFAKYKYYLKWFNNEVFTDEQINKLIDQYYLMITPYVIGEDGEKQGYTHLKSEDAFSNAYLELKKHIAKRKLLVSTYVE